MTDALRIGLAGIGTVGAGVAKVLLHNANALAARAGRPLVITAVSARARKKIRGIDLSHIPWVANAAALAGRDDVDVVVELIGGENGVAYDLAQASLKNRKHLVTANKAMLAYHGAGLAHLAETNEVALKFEAAK